MFDRLNTLLLSGMITVVLATQALGQVAKSPGGPSSPTTNQFSVEKAWNWLMARPGVMLAIAIVVAAVAYAIVANKRKKAS